MLLARAGLAEFASALFAYPQKRPDFALAQRAAARVGGAVSKDIDRLEARWEESGLCALQGEWLRLFSLTPLCPPYETAGSEDALRKGAVLADIAGFYRAFGLRPEGEMADHIATEMGFAAFLLTKLAYARARRQSQHAAVTRDALERFFTEHLGPFGRRFFPQAEATAGPFYRAAAGFGRRITRELQRLVGNGRGTRRVPSPPHSPGECSRASLTRRPMKMAVQGPLSRITQ